MLSCTVTIYSTATACQNGSSMLARQIYARPRKCRPPGNLFLRGRAESMRVNGELAVNSPSPRTLMRSSLRRIKPCARSNSGVTVSPAGKTFKFFQVHDGVYEAENGLWNPRLGMRRCRGIWPPSKPRRREYPRRDFCPLLPGSRGLAELRAHAAADANFLVARAARRTARLERLRLRAPLAGRLVRSFSAPALRQDRLPACAIAIFALAIPLLHNFHEMSHLVNHAANFRCVLALHHVVHAAQTEATDRGAHIVGAGDEAHHPLNLDASPCSLISSWRFLLVCH